MPDTVLIFDYDCLIYKYGFANEVRSVRVQNNETKEIITCKNITEFWGRGKKIGGKLKDINIERISEGLPELTKEDFTQLEFERESNPIAMVLSDVKKGIQNLLKQTGATRYYGYVGKGESFREHLSSLLKYKGNREESVKPLLYKDITNYLVNYHNAEVVEGEEADDWVIISAIKEEKEGNRAIVIAEDKDALGNPVQVLNPFKQDLGVINCKQWGELYRQVRISDGEEVLGDVLGYGMIWFMFQVLSGDPVDNFRPQSHSDVPWGQVTAYETLKDAKNVKEALSILVESFKTLYPEAKKITSWRGDTIAIDWLYVLDEMWDMARMKKFEGDNTKASEVLLAYKIISQIELDQILKERYELRRS